MSSKLYYIYDPMCSWCWGCRPVWDLLQQHLPKSIAVEYVVGGLAADSDSAMPIAQQQMIQNHWRTIEQKLGAQHITPVEQRLQQISSLVRNP